MIAIRPARTEDLEEWLRMRLALWPDHSAEAFRAEMQAMLQNPLTPVFVAVRPDGRLGGFLEGGLRNYAEGCATSPVAYVEGWYVDPDLRRQGVGRRLMAAMEAWAVENGLRELASDAELDNTVSQEAHRALGFAESDRIVTFRKALPASERPLPQGITLAELTARMHAFVRSKGWYAAESPRPQTPRNLAISLSLEAAEVLEHFQWRETFDREALAEELADVTLYLLQLADLSGVNLQQAVLAKLARNAQRSWDEEEKA